MTRPQAERPWMPDYGVDTPEWSPLPWSWAAERLVANKNFWVVTASAEGRPHATPVWGVWNDEILRFAFSCGPRSRKASNLAVNSQTVVAIDDTVESLSVEGLARPIDDTEQQEMWIDLYLEKYQPMSPDLNADFLRQEPMYEFVPDRAFAVIERVEDFSTRATRWRF